MEVKEIKYLLSDRNLREVSRRTGISYSTLRNITSSKDPDPSIKTVNKLREYFSTTCPGLTHG
jgi:transcriptional regulator with XRE-family HTH domain